MLPSKHTSLIIADGRRARAWESGMRRSGLSVKRVDTAGPDSEQGAFYLVVPNSQLKEGQRYVSEVLAGKRSLPSVAPIGGVLLLGAGLIVLSMVVLLASAWLR